MTIVAAKPLSSMLDAGFRSGIFNGYNRLKPILSALISREYLTGMVIRLLLLLTIFSIHSHAASPKEFLEMIQTVQNGSE